MTIPYWPDGALCAQSDSEQWFPPPGGTPEPAKAICRRCPLVQECLDYALAHNIRYGIWGATTAVERAQLRKAAS